MRDLFGTDGVRGIANQDLTVHLCLRIARAAATVLHRSGDDRPRVVMGRDTRQSGDMIETAMIAGFCSAGADVISVGVMPTAGIAYLAHVLDVDMGAVISASHNPYEFNGIKFFSHEGYKLPDAVEQEIEARVHSTEHLDHPTGAGLGRRLDPGHACERYLEFLYGLLPQDLAGMRIVIDCANGAVSGMAPVLFRKMNAEVIALNDGPDGLNINAGCGALYPEVAAQAVRDAGADVGLSFDGDADRLLMSDETGRVVNGDHILAIAGHHFANAGRLPGGLVVGTVMSNLGLERALEQHDLRLLRTKVGDRYVLEEMRARGAILGGEQSGHIIFLDHATTGDGLVTALMMLRIMRQTGTPLSVLANLVEEYPQRLVNVTVASTHGWDDNDTVRQAIAEAAADLGDEGRVLVRASGTEPKIRVMVEALRREKVDYWTDELAGVIRRQLAA